MAKLDRRHAGSVAPRVPATRSSAKGAATIASSGRRSASAPTRPDRGKRRVAGEARVPGSRHEARGRDVLRSGSRDAVEHLAHDVLGRDPLHPELGAKDEPVRQRRDCDRLDVVREDVVAAVERCPAARELEEREAPARARADRDALRRTGRGDDVDAVLAHALGHVYPLHGLPASRAASRDRRRRGARRRRTRARCGA